jgi:hypothetical protein
LLTRPKDTARRSFCGNNGTFLSKRQKKEPGPNPQKLTYDGSDRRKKRDEKGIFFFLPTNQPPRLKRTQRKAQKEKGAVKNKSEP